MYRLIIADDEENIRNGIANSLPWRDWGYEVCALCASGQEVLAKMETCRPDVVLSDIRMPGMDGVELMQRLSRDYPEVKIVILSGYSDFKYLNMSIKNHVAEYLLKPTDIDDFEESFRRLKAAMDHERLLEILDRDYSADPIAKQYAIIHTNNALFESYSRLVQQERIGAIYLVGRRDVLDFQDPNQVTTLLIKKLEELDVNNPEKLGKFYFYPLQKNFLRTETYGDPRQDLAVIGSRRVYSALKSGYPYVHIFAVKEQSLYELYELQAKRLGAEVYVLTGDGELISSSNEEAVAACQAPAEVVEAAAGLQEDSATVRVGACCTMWPPP